MTVGLNSNLSASSFARFPLNLVIVLDISGSMGSPFKGNASRGSDSQSKLNIAKNLIMKIVEKLGEQDRLAVVAFHTDAIELQPLVFLSANQKKDVQQTVDRLRADGGTNMAKAVDASSKLFDRIDLTNGYDNRIIFLTDAQTNSGELSVDYFKTQMKKNAERRIYTTFIGLGIDLQTQLIQEITNIRGANYFAVHDQTNFCQLLDDDFELIVTPLVFNLQLRLQSKQFQIDHVFGSPDYAESTEQLMKINTLFPSRTRDDGSSTRGGVVLIRLKKTKDSSDENYDLHLTMTYEDRLGHVAEEKSSIDLREQVSPSVSEGAHPRPPFFGNSGIRKAILLVEYVTLLKAWIRNERDHFYNHQPLLFSIINQDNAWLYLSVQHSRPTWERQNTPLKVSSLYRSLFSNFEAYFEEEMLALKDDDLKQELVILEKIIGHSR